MSLLNSFKQLWNIWELRGFLLFSFGLQCILVLTASMRKRTSNMVWIGLIWLTYLLADWSAYYAIGLIPPPRTRTNGSEHDKYYGDLQAFWAPFLLLHIGGPTTIAAFSLEDNETWRRSAFHLLGQAGLTLFIMHRALTPHYSSPLLAPTLFMFVAAFSRYLERVLALYYASMDKFRDSAFQDRLFAFRNRDFGSNFESLSQNNTPSRRRLSEVEIVKYSYILFQSFKWIFADLSIYATNKIYELSKRYLLEVLNPEEAFKEMEIQMNLAYDIFYTKTWLIVETKVGRTLHAVSLCSEMAALVLWGLASKTRYSSVDVRVTNALVLGGAVVDVVSCFKLLFSDAMIPKLAKMRWVRESDMLNKALSLRDHGFLSRWLMINRWSGTIPQYNLKDAPNWIFSNNKCASLIWKFVETYVVRLSRSVKVSAQVKRRIVEQIKDKVDAISRDGASLELSNLGCFMREEHRWKELDIILTNALHVDALYVCHTATMCLFGEEPNYTTDVSKQVADYLFCDLVDQGSNLIADQWEIKRIEFEERFSISTWRRTCQGEERPTLAQVQEALTYLHSKRSSAPMNGDLVDTFVDHIKVHLKELGHEAATSVVEDMWLGLLCSTASRCMGRAHLERLSKGGELLTLVWLLLTNVGLINNIEVDEDYDR